MKMQLGKILILPAVDDQTIGGELEFGHQQLHGGEQVRQESRVRVEIHQTGDGLLGKEHNMQRIGWFRMVERQQGFSLSQSLDRDRKTHIFKYPSDQLTARPGARQP